MKTMSIVAGLLLLACSSTVLAQPKPNRLQLADQVSNRLMAERAERDRKAELDRKADLAEQARKAENWRAEVTRKATIDRLMNAISSGTKVDAEYVANIEGDPAADRLVSSYTNTSHSALDELKKIKIDEKALSDATQLVDTIEKNIARLVGEETKCRAKPMCMAGRMVLYICDNINTRKVLTYELARERANAAGVVDLRTLHNTGEQITDMNREIKESKAAYQKLAKKAFADSLCK